MPQGDAVLARAQQRDPDLPEVVALLLLLAAGGEFAANVGRSNEGEEVGRVEK